jgi:arabinose-5-phosphate isomerase
MGQPAPCVVDAPRPPALTDREIAACGRRIVAQEARALVNLLPRIDDRFAAAVRLVVELRGSLIVTGMGKAGLIGQKLAATFASTGARAHFLHPAEAMHGDLGRIGHDDAVLALSQSGETAETVQLIAPLRAAGVPLIAMTSAAHSTLGRAATIALALGPIPEACALGLAPSASTAAMLALGDALALAVSQLRGFTAHDFARFHPGGALGRKLSRVDDHMRPLSACRLAHRDATVREVLVTSTRPGRRTGAVMLVDDRGRLAGLFTDSDLARLIERRCDEALDRPISAVMTASPATVDAGAPLARAIELLAERKFSELPVVDADGRPLGLIDVTDVLEVAPDPPTTDAAAPAVLRLFAADAAPGGSDVQDEGPCSTT